MNKLSFHRYLLLEYKRYLGMLKPTHSGLSIELPETPGRPQKYGGHTVDGSHIIERRSVRKSSDE